MKFKINIMQIVGALLIGLLFANKYYEKSNKTYDASGNIVKEILVDIENIEAAALSENPFSDVEFNIIENPRNDKELALNLIREYFIKIQNNHNETMEKILNLRSISPMIDIRNTKQLLLELDSSDIKEDFQKGLEISYESKSVIESTIAEFLTKPEPNYFLNEKIGDELIEGFKEGLLNASVFQSALFEMDLASQRIIFDYIIALKNCSNDLQTEETEEGHILNFDNVGDQDLERITELLNKLETENQQYNNVLQSYYKTIRASILEI